MSGNILAFSCGLAPGSVPPCISLWLASLRRRSSTWRPVPYNGAPPAVLDLIANRVPLMMTSTGNVAQHIDSGALKALVTVGSTRSPLLPDVPTISEAGYPEANLVAWYGYGVPRGTPRLVVDKI